MVIRIIALAVALLAAASITNAAPSIFQQPPSVLAESQVSLRYGTSLIMATDAAVSENSDQTGLGSSGKQPGHKSPGKAFLLSAAVPGLGQLYNGNKIKAATFFAADVTAWVLHFKWHKDGDDMTDAFNVFNDDHWKQVNYETYLQLAYGYSDDDSIQATEVSHHLPDTKTQQYYEMTGKYNQFAWGWDDATLDQKALNDYVTADSIPVAVDPNVPQSANRNKYEQMRADANSRYDRAQTMIIVAMVNRLISGFEAFLSARRHNARIESGGEEFSRLSVRTSMRSVYTRWDTPYLKLAYRF